MTCRCWWSCSIGKNGREPRTDGPIWYWPGSASFAETIQVLARRKSSRRSSYRLRLFFLSFYPRRLIIDPRWPNPWRLCNCKNSAKIAPPFFVKKQEEEMREGGDNKKRWPQTEQRERERGKNGFTVGHASVSHGGRFDGTFWPWGINSIDSITVRATRANKRRREKKENLWAGRCFFWCNTSFISTCLNGPTIRDRTESICKRGKTRNRIAGYHMTSDSFWKKKKKNHFPFFHLQKAASALPHPFSGPGHLSSDRRATFLNARHSICSSTLLRWNH